VDDTKKARPTHLVAQALFEDGNAITVRLDLWDDDLDAKGRVHVMASAADAMTSSEGPALVLTDMGARFVTEAIGFLRDRERSFILASSEYHDPDEEPREVCLRCEHWNTDEERCAVSGTFTASTQYQCQQWEAKRTCSDCDHFDPDGSPNPKSGICEADPDRPVCRRTYTCDDWKAKTEDDPINPTCADCEYWCAPRDPINRGACVCEHNNSARTSSVDSCSWWKATLDRPTEKATCGECDWWRPYPELRSLGECTEPGKGKVEVTSDDGCNLWKAKEGGDHDPE